MTEYTIGSFVNDLFAAVGVATVFFLVLVILGSMVGRMLGGPREATSVPAKALHLSPNTSNLDNLEAILADGYPLSMEDQRSLCVALRRAWDANADGITRLAIAEQRLEEAMRSPRAVA